ncbi:MAG: hypothetical protein EA403_12300 [Spirochaetaceae bacterium]|nr:MAG: hypothetical protein EA403_12300 [Spirochaetaceae bacterium]
MKNDPTAGVYYIATGQKFVAEAIVSARYVREKMPDVPIAIATDVTPDYDFDHVIQIDEPRHSFEDIILQLHRSPFHKTIHFDTDIYMYASTYELFEVLDRFEIGAAHNQNRSVFFPPGIPDSFPEYNCGMLIYNNTDRFRVFTQSWKTYYDQFATGGKNQPSFRKALYESDLRVVTLPPEYNLMLRYPGHAIGTIKLFHGRLLDIPTPGAKMYVDVLQAARKINSLTGHRVFTLGGGVTLYTNESRRIKRLFAAYRRYGPIGMLRKARARVRKPLTTR